MILRAPANRQRLCELLRALHRAVDGLRQMLVEHLANLRLRYHADEVIHDRAVLEEHDRRQAAHADLLRQFLLLVGIHLGELEAPPYCLASRSRIGMS